MKIIISLLFIIVPLIHIPFLNEYTYETPKKFFVCFLTAIALILLIKKKKLYYSKTLIPFLFFILINFLFLFITPYRFYGIDRIYLLLVELSLLFIGINYVGDKKFILTILFITLCVVSLIGIFQYVDIIKVDWTKVPWEKGFGKRVYSTIGNPNFLCTLLLPFVSLSLVFSLTGSHKKYRHIYSAVFVIGFSCFLFTNSWSSYMAFVAMVITLCISFFINKIKIYKEDSKFLYTMCSIILGVFLITKGKKIFGEPTGFIARLLLWDGAIHMIKDKPITGFGPDCSYAYNPKYLGKLSTKPYYDKLWIARPDFILRNPGRPHNEYLNIPIDAGFIGLAIFIWFTISLIKSFIKKIKVSIEIEQFLSISMLSTFIGYLIQDITDYPFRLWGESFLFFILAGMACQKDILKISFRIIFNTVICCFSILLIYWGTSHLLSSFYYTKAQIAEDKKDYKNMIGYCNNAIKFGPVTHIVYGMLGRIYYELGDYQKSIENYIKSMEIQPFHEVLHFNIAAPYIKIGDTAKAIKELELAMELEPRYGTAAAKLASLYKKLGKIDTAEAILKNCTKYFLYEASPYNELGILYAQKGEKSKAEEYFKKTCMFASRNSIGWYNLYLLKNNYNNYIDIDGYEWILSKMEKGEYIEILDKFHRFPESMFKLGQILINNNDKSGIDSIKIAFNIAPTIPEIKIYLLKILAKYGELKRADSLMFLATKYYDEGKKPLAENKLHEAIKHNPAFSQAYYNLGVLYTENKEYKKAIENFEKFIIIEPNHKDARKIISEIMRLKSLL